MVTKRSAKQDKMVNAGIKGLAMLIGKAAFSFLTGIFVMLSFGVLHSYVFAVPAFGYWACVLFTYTLIAFKSVKVESK